MGIESGFFAKRYEAQDSTVEHGEKQMTSTASRYEHGRTNARPRTEQLSPHINSGREVERLRGLFGKAKKCAEVFLLISTLSGVPGMVEGQLSLSDTAEALQRSKDQQYEQLAKHAMDRNISKDIEERPSISEVA